MFIIERTIASKTFSIYTIAAPFERFGIEFPRELLTPSRLLQSREDLRLRCQLKSLVFQRRLLEYLSRQSWYNPCLDEGRALRLCFADVIILLTNISNNVGTLSKNRHLSYVGQRSRITISITNRQCSYS